MKNELVSIILPVESDSVLLRDTIDSVVSQTYLNWELFVVCKPSLDSITQLVSEYVCQDSRIKLLVASNPGRLSKVHNLGIEHASGSFIAFINDGDKWYANKLEKQVLFMLREYYHCTYTYYVEIDDNGGKKHTQITDILSRRLDFRNLLKHPAIPCGIGMLRTSFFPKIYMPDIPSDLEKWQDYLLWLTILQTIPAAYCLEEVLISTRPGSIGTVRAKHIGIKTRWKIYNKFLQLSRLSSFCYLLQYFFRYVYLRLF